jgi:hypothetical protein
MISAILWLAAGAHAAPCAMTGHCATYLDCEPHSLTCLNPGHVDVHIEQFSLCGAHDDITVEITATNTGEIAVSEAVDITTQLNVSYVDATCEPDGPGLTNGWSYQINDPAAQILLWPSDSKRVALEPGKSVAFTSQLSTYLPNYTYKLDAVAFVTTPSGGSDVASEQRSVQPVTEDDLVKSCGSPDAICK